MKKYTLKKSSQLISTNINYAKDLNSEQLEVVTEANGPCLVLAGAGSGKTRTLTYRVAHLLEKGVNPNNILLATFTNKAAAQMRNRVEVLLKTQVKGLWCGTFHHLGNRLLRIYGKDISINPDFNIMDAEDARTLIKTCIKELKINSKDKIFPTPKIIQSIISYARNTKTNTTDIVNAYYPDFSEIIESIIAIDSLYSKKKTTSNSLDYDDLLTEPLRLLNQSQSARDRLTRQFQNILVDEYQDTNRLQFEIIKILTEGHNNILAVGDDAQSIYAFRGATIDNILNFPKEYPSAKIFKLQTNYRSNQNILDLANESISYNRQQYEKRLKTVKEKGEKPALVRTRDMRQQSTFVVQKISELIDNGYDLGEIAVLFRAHYQSVELELALLKRGIPYIVRGGIKFFEQAHVKDVLSYIRIIQNPLDEIAWVRALSVEEGIGAVFSSKIFNNFKQNCKSLKDLFNDKSWGFLSNKSKWAFERFRKVIATIKKDDVYLNISLMLEAIIDSKYEQYCIGHFENYKDRLDDLKELINFAHSYKSLKSFLTDATLGETFKGETVLESSKDASNYLVLSTIHQAKGLEWGTVILIGLIDDQFPHAKSKEDMRQMEEERRLFYVAVTRAKDLLYLMHPMMRYDYNYGNVIARPSTFTEELPLDCYEVWETEQEEIDLEESQLLPNYD